MRILLHCPTRSRPTKVNATLKLYMQLANHPEQIGVAVSCDDDDSSMTRPSIQEELHRTLAPSAWHRIFFGPNKTKIQACNANMNEVDWEWDIVVLVSDDMIPKIKGYDDVIRNYMLSRFPDTNGLLWFNDGCQGEKLNTLCIYGREFYRSLGHIYEPSYKSLFCDTELTDRCRSDLKDRCLYVPYCIIRHEHPGTGFAQNNDALYMTNQKYWTEDMMTYINRKNYPYHWSVLIPTIPGREQSLRKLIESIQEKRARLAPDMKLEICIDFDNREASIGDKRQSLLQRAAGKYLSFVDDDDEITDEYISDLWECIKGNYHVMKLNGTFGGYVFYHSVSVSPSDTMATMDDPPLFRRPPNHLNPMLADVAKLIPFVGGISIGEDFEWSLKLLATGFLRREYATDHTHYLYILNTTTRPVTQDIIDKQRNLSFSGLANLISQQRAGMQAAARLSEPGQQRLKLGAKGFVSK